MADSIFGGEAVSGPQGTLEAQKAARLALIESIFGAPASAAPLPVSLPGVQSLGNQGGDGAPQSRFSGAEDAAGRVAIGNERALSSRERAFEDSGQTEDDDVFDKFGQKISGITLGDVAKAVGLTAVNTALPGLGTAISGGSLLANTISNDPNRGRVGLGLVGSGLPGTPGANPALANIPGARARSESVKRGREAEEAQAARDEQAQRNRERARERSGDGGGLGSGASRGATLGRSSGPGQRGRR